jgi:hypothetical protein
VSAGRDEPDRVPQWPGWPRNTSARDAFARDAWHDPFCGASFVLRFMPTDTVSDGTQFGRSPAYLSL